MSPARQQRKAGTSESLAQLLAFWIREGSVASQEALVLLTLETVRDEICQAVLTDGKAVSGSQEMQEYLDDVITELRRLCDHEP